MLAKLQFVLPFLIEPDKVCRQIEKYYIRKMNIAYINCLCKMSRFAPDFIQRTAIICAMTLQ